MVEHTPFRISSALKNIIGQDLITNDFVAVFELVKNSFDAYATNVEIEFAEGSITIIDNGKGMSRQDILQKWLFVAYSAKADRTEDDESEKGFRYKIKVKRGFAGSKGIGRFSCDRLGANLDLYAREKTETKTAHLCVNWGSFEESAKREFGEVQVDLSEITNPPKPDRAKKLGPQGVMLRITNLRSGWDETKVRKLRAYLARLVDPFSTATDLNITTYFFGTNDPTLTGEVGNDIASVLDQKTTKIEAVIDGENIISTLTDRGTLVYKISEENQYEELHGVIIRVTIFYLNRSAKKTFTTRMGIAPVEFGNLFLFVNGFRVFPVGEPTDDTFGIGRRKQQGTSRFLGLRDVIGAVRVETEPGRFREASSRNNGLIETADVAQLYEAVDHGVFRRLERYVTKVAWPDPLDQDRDDVSGLRTNSGRARIVEIVRSLVGSKNVQLIDFDRDLVNVVEERASEFDRTMGALVAIAGETGDEALLRRVEQSRARYEDLIAAERDAQEAAKRADQAREAAERTAKNATANAAIATERAGTLAQQVRLLGAAQSRDSEHLNLMLHQIVIYAAELDSLVRRSLKGIGRLENFLPRIDEETAESFKGGIDDVAELIGRIGFQSRRIQIVGKVATQASIALDSGRIKGDMIQFMGEYIDDVVSVYTPDVKIIFDSNDTELKRTFSPFDIAVLLENFVSNSKKNGAKTFRVSCSLGTKRDTVSLVFEDDGPGIDERRVDPTRIFDKGYSGGRNGGGSGLGLYHARQVAEELGGSLALDPIRKANEARFILTLPRDKS